MGINIASMEPRSFNRGDDGSGKTLLATHIALQWSHGRLTVVTLTPRWPSLRLYGLQWSHGRLTVVTVMTFSHVIMEHLSFNGATVV